MASHMDPSKTPLARPPPGQRSNLVDPPSLTANVLACHIICLFFATLCTGIRLYTRRFIIHKLGLDDYLCIFSWLLTIVFSGLTLEANHQGMGRYMWDIPYSHLAPIRKPFVIAEWIYLIEAASIKLSCIVFFRRIFGRDQIMKFLANFGIGFVLLSANSVLVATIMNCIPVAKNWDPTLPGTCLPPEGLPYASGALNVVTDIYIVVVPLFRVWKLNMSFAKKMRLVVLFGLGVVAVACSITRLAMTYILFVNADKFWNTTIISWFSVIEVNIGIICASLLSFPAFIDKHWPDSVSRSIQRLFSATFRRHSGDSPEAGNTRHAPPPKAGERETHQLSNIIDAYRRDSAHTGSHIRDESGSEAEIGLREGERMY